MFGRNKAAMLVAEFIGTMLLTLAVISVRSSGIGYSLFVALGAGVTVGALTLAVGVTSGAQFNPALTLGLWVSRKVKTIPGILYIIVQLLGGLAAWGIFSYIAKQHLPASTGHFQARIMLAEALGTFVFAFGWMAAVSQGFKGLRLAFAAGGAFAVGIMVASIGSTGVINPAIALGTRTWVWGTYVLGPVVGGIVGVGLYNLLFVPWVAKKASVRVSASTTKSSAKKTTKKKK